MGIQNKGGRAEQQRCSLQYFSEMKIDNLIPEIFA